MHFLTTCTFLIILHATYVGSIQISRDNNRTVLSKSTQSSKYGIQLNIGKYVKCVLICQKKTCSCCKDLILIKVCIALTLDPAKKIVGFEAKIGNADLISINISVNATDICRSVPLNKNLKADVCIDIPIIETSKNSPTFRVCPSIYGKIGLSKITVGLDFPCWYYEGQLVFKVEDLLDIKAWSNLIGTFVK